MTDITAFLNSKDIAEHWKKIGFSCTPVQAAYIIYASRERSLQEKHEAWKELIETTPDCSLAEGRRKEGMKHFDIPDALTGSLHAFLRAYMALEDKTSERFYREEENTAYGYRSFPESRYAAEWHNDFWLYRTAQDCLDDVNGEAPNRELAVVEVKKYWIGEADVIVAQMRADGTLMSLYDEGWTEKEFRLMEGGFPSLWFDLPMPFRRGDVLMRKNSPFLGEVERPQPFVLTRLNSWGREDALQMGESEERATGFETLLQWRREVAGSREMRARGYLLKDGSLQEDDIERCLDLEYCREELKGKERILKALSLYEKGKIGIELLLKTYHIVFMEEETRREKKSLHDLLSTALKEVGIDEEQTIGGPQDGASKNDK